MQQVTILGRRWNIGTFRSTKYNGHCDDPADANKAVLVERSLVGREAFENLLHEMLHAASWHLDEDHVAQFAADVARVADRIGLLKEDAGVKHLDVYTATDSTGQKYSRDSQT